MEYYQSAGLGARKSPHSKEFVLRGAKSFLITAGVLLLIGQAAVNIALSAKLSTLERSMQDKVTNLYNMVDHEASTLEPK
jgi:hypothetical protein